jgi:hypothetical protein
MSYYSITTTGDSAPTCFVKVRTEPRRKEDSHQEDANKKEEDDE